MRLVINKRTSEAYKLLPWWVELVEDTGDVVIVHESIAAFRTREQAETWIKEQHG